MSSWEERMSQRAKARMAVAEAEQITREAADTEPARCGLCGNLLLPDGGLYLSDGRDWFHADCWHYEDIRG